MNIFLLLSNISLGEITFTILIISLIFGVNLLQPIVKGFIACIRDFKSGMKDVDL